MKERLQALFAADLTLAGYHLALDAHPEIGNNALLAKELGVKVERRFGKIGLGGSLADPTSVGAFVERVAERLGSDPLVFDDGPPEVLRVAISSGRAGYDLELAATEGYELFITASPRKEASTSRVSWRSTSWQPATTRPNASAYRHSLPA
jgi:putative NIF3 family GTP cyclohydrolase 1 type 2